MPMLSAKKIITTLLLLLISLPSPTALAWPGNKKAAIVLTYDDALASQLNVAIPQLNQANLKGTFFLDGRMTEQEITRWRQASKKRHELGNHTLFHPCSRTILQTEAHYASENYNVEIMLREIALMNRFLFAIDDQRTRSYAYPCTEYVVGHTDYTDALKRSGLIRYARAGGDKNSIITDFRRLDPYRVPSWGLAQQTDGADLIDFVKRVRQAQGLGVFMFHGVGGDYLEVSAKAHAQLLKYLREHQADVWVGTFQEVMDYVMKHESRG